MPDVKRNEAEAEFDRVFIAGIMVKAGRDVSAPQVMRLLNRRREGEAREAARLAGKTVEEAEEAAALARVGVHTVRREISMLKAAAQDAWTAGAAVFLDDQIAAVRDEIEETHRMDEEIMLDLERSRSPSWVRTKGSRGDDGRIEAQEVTRHRVEEGAAAAGLYGRLQENMRRRAALRAEERMLRFGRQVMPEPEEPGEELTMAQAVMDLDDPDKARDAALSMIRQTLKGLAKASSAPMSGDMLAFEQLRLKKMEARIRSLREYVRSEEEEEGPASFEVVFSRLPRKELETGPAGKDENRD